MKRSERLGRVKERYLRDNQSTMLGGLAANLARVQSFSSNDSHMQAVEDLIVESEHFIEWLAPSTELPELERLAALQLELAKWRCGLRELWQDELERKHMAETANRHSQEVLEMSGLLVETRQS